MINCFTHRGISLEYEVSGQGTPLVFLHGLGAASGRFRIRIRTPRAISSR